MEHAAERASLESIPLLARALSYEDSLRRRTEGLTWAIWGVVMALIFFMYAGMGELGEDGGPAWATLLWVPWVLVGSALTWALWRTSALSLAGGERRPAGLAVTLAWIGAIVLGLAAMMLGPRLPNPDHSALVSVGLAWLFMGGTNLFRATPSGRRATLAIGATTLALGLAFSFLLPAPSWRAPDAALVRFLQDILRGAAAAGPPLAFGLWQALRG
ncbi:MAG TPA: hypothetical protein VM582_04030 [Candidatus Thermoplasmatota archaeon]|nr:hypothetical protein [Candidatus Thermoplasmatota archaeon]